MASQAMNYDRNMRKTGGRRRKKIVHLITGLGLGGAENMLFKLLQSMKADLFSSSVISMMDEGAYGPKIFALGVPIYTLNMRQGRPTINSIHRLKKIVGTLEPDLIQGWMYHGNLAAVAAKSFANSRPLVYWNVRQTLNEFQHEKNLTKLVIKLGAYLSSSPGRIIYNSAASAVQHEAIGYPVRKRVIIPNGFDITAFHRSERSRLVIRSELGITENQPLVGTVARFHPIKDYGNLIRAAEIVLQERPNVQFAFVGTGVNCEQAALRGPIEAASLSSVCHLLGERRDVADVMSAFDVFVLPSKGEGFPNVIGEAMSCELPCIVTDVGDAPVVVNGNGVVVPVGDPWALAAAIEDMLGKSTDERRNVGRRARRHISEFYAMEKITALYESEYVNALLDYEGSVSSE